MARWRRWKRRSRLPAISKYFKEGLAKALLQAIADGRILNALLDSVKKRAADD